MVTTLKNETNTAVADNSAVVVDAVAPAAAADVSAIPETPAELLKQWDVSRRPLAHRVVATVARFWEGLTGPAMTERDRLTREIAEAKGNANGFIKMT